MRQLNYQQKLVFFAAAVLAGAAPCPGNRARSQEVMIVSPVRGAGVDAARVGRDIQQIEGRKDRGVILLPDQAKANRSQPAVPVFAPPGVIEMFLKTGEKGVQESAASNGCNALIDYPDEGYAVDCQNDRYQISIRGTNKSFTDNRTKSGDSPAPEDYVNPFSESESGGTISFGYAGAHYIAAFECLSDKAGCITSSEADRILAELMLCGLGNKCVERGVELIKR